MSITGILWSANVFVGRRAVEMSITLDEFLFNRLNMFLVEVYLCRVLCLLLVKVLGFVH